MDLLWNGGIGTYVKASTESHADVGDRANDAVRVDGADLRAVVVGEGGNLGFTQLGRIEYAARGWPHQHRRDRQLGGVDCSDHEVNLKILLALAVDADELTVAERDSAAAAARRRRRAPRAVRQLPAGADPVAGDDGVAAADGSV